MDTKMHCDIVSAEESIFSGNVEMVIAAGSLGDLGISFGHAPLLTALIPGPVRLIKMMVMKKYSMFRAASSKFNEIRLPCLPIPR